MVSLVVGGGERCNVVRPLYFVPKKAGLIRKHLPVKDLIMTCVGLVPSLFGCGQSAAPGSSQRVLAAFQSGSLAPDTQGVIRLPTDLADASVDGRAFVTTNRSGPWLLLRTWIGKGANLDGYLYAPGMQVTNGGSIEVNTDDAGAIGPAEVTVEKALTDSWYFVHRGDD